MVIPLLVEIGRQVSVAQHAMRPASWFQWRCWPEPFACGQPRPWRSRGLPVGVGSTGLVPAPNRPMADQPKSASSLLQRPMSRRTSRAVPSSYSMMVAQACAHRSSRERSRASAPQGARVLAGGYRRWRGLDCGCARRRSRRASAGAVALDSGRGLFALLERHVGALGIARIELPRPSDLLVRILDHLVPLRDPADRARDREQRGEHAGREAHRLEDDA